MRIGLLVVCLGLLAPNGVSAAILSQYFFTSGSAASSDTDALSNSANFNLQATNSSISASSHNLFLRSSDTSSTTLSTAITNNTYVGFTITPIFGQALSLDSLAFLHGASNSDNDASFLTTVSIKSSIGGFGDSDPTLGTFTKDVATGNGGAGITDLRSIDLAALGPLFAGITTPVEFRFYFYDNASSTNKIHRLDSVELNGTIAAVPEPGAAFLGGAAILGGFMIWHRRSGGGNRTK